MTIRSNSSGRSNMAKCPVSGISTSSEPGIMEASSRVWSGSIASSCSPSTDQDGGRDRAELLFGERRLGGPHPADVADELLPSGRIGRQPLIVLCRALDVRTEHRVLERVRAETTRVEVGAVRDDAVEAFRVGDGKVQPDDATVAPAHDRCRVQAQVVHHSEHIRGHEIVGDRSLVEGGSAVTAAVQDDRPGDVSDSDGSDSAQ